MVKKLEKTITFHNKTDKNVQVYIEPAAESFILLSDKKAIFKIYYIEDIKTDPFDIEFDNDSISVYEGQGMLLKIFIDEQLVYYTDYS